MYADDLPYGVALRSKKTVETVSEGAGAPGAVLNMFTTIHFCSSHNIHKFLNQSIRNFLRHGLQAQKEKSV